MSTARARVLDTATRLFYAEGIHTVGIDRVIADAAVAKATFYHHFKSKEELVLAYLTTEFDRERAVLDADRKADLLLLIRDGITVAGGLGDQAAVQAGVAAALAAV